MTYEEVYETFKDKIKETDVSGIQGHLAYQFNIVGEGAGAFYAEVNDGKLNIQPYDYYDRDALFTCKADTLLKIISGKLDPVMAFTMGRLKIEGSVEKALLLKSFIPEKKKSRKSVL